MEIVLLIIGLAVGAAAGFFYAKSKLSARDAELGMLKESAQQYKEQLSQSQTEILRLTGELSTSKTKLEELTTGREQQKNEFKAIAAEILKSHTADFSKTSTDKLSSLLEPFGKEIHEFKKRINETHESQITRQSSLEGQIKKLTELNIRISDEANNLTKALKGDNKKMGSWGEIVLERILEESGLIKGEEYKTQDSFTTESGSRLQPDVVVYLPDKKHLVIDSKVSLIDYESYCSADSEEKAIAALKAHITSLRTHIKGLASKSYEYISELETPDFVMMFIPIDGALFSALQEDKKLFMDAYENRVYLVSPTTLLFALRTIANLWRYEKQNINALDIANRGGKLYDKLAGFVESFEDISKKLGAAQASYDKALGQLSEGPGNVIWQAQQLKELGVKAKRSLPAEMLERAGSDAALIEPAVGEE
ncbi:MAG: DNA recombination protein RmuC [Phycisphaerae bacterium]